MIPEIPSGLSTDRVHIYTLCKWHINRCWFADDEYLSYYHRTSVVHECKRRVEFTHEHNTWGSKWAVY